MQHAMGSAEQLKQSFREEAREIVVELESSLLELNENPGNMELVSRVFRALHTIKGSGAMFGFDHLAGFAHSFENVFDQIRDGRLSVSERLVDLSLEALDQIKAMLENDALEPPAACAAILAGLQQLAGPVPGAAPRPEAPQPAPALLMEAGATRTWKMRFYPGPEMLRNGSNPLLLLRELGQLGQLALKASMASVPPLRELDPERCYIGWDMTLVTAVGRDEIRDVFIFVEDGCELTIEPEDADIAAEPGQADVSAADLTAIGLQEMRKGDRRAQGRPQDGSSLRVPSVKLDQFVDLVGELVTVQARLGDLACRLDDPEVSSVSAEVERLTSALREISMDMRLVPIRPTFEKFRRLVHDLARDLGKEVELTMEGADTELDKTVIDQLSDPLMHLIRNSMDHGIEPPAVRAARGKRSLATIHLSARHSGANVLIAVSDDGGGIDAQAVRRLAVERGLLTQEATLSEAETFALIFRPGFSTAKQVTDVSGRGVGMDVVRQRVDSLRGSIDVQSNSGAGTTVTLRLPLTMAIIEGLLIGVGEDRFVLPLASTLECIELTREDVRRANGRHVIEVRGELLPYIHLRQHFNIGGEHPAIEQIMVVETDDGRYGFVADCVLGNYQTVIKSLGRFYRHVQGVSGATILGNGKLALIIDPQRLAREVTQAATRSGRARSSELRKAYKSFVGSGQKASAGQVTIQPDGL